MSDCYGKSPSPLRAQSVWTVVFMLFRKTMQSRMLRIAVLVFFGGCCATAHAQFYAGVLGGVSTLSGDARSVLSPGSNAFSSYDSKSGATLELLAGRHFSDYFTIQASYIWNPNELTLTSATFNNGTQQGYQESRSSSQQSVTSDFLVYFRNRDSRLRPYLSVGSGLVHFASSRERLDQVLGTPCSATSALRFQHDCPSRSGRDGCELGKRLGVSLHLQRNPDQESRQRSLVATWTAQLEEFPKLVRICQAILNRPIYPTRLLRRSSTEHTDIRSNRSAHFPCVPPAPARDRRDRC